MSNCVSLNAKYHPNSVAATPTPATASNGVIIEPMVHHHHCALYPETNLSLSPDAESAGGQWHINEIRINYALEGWFGCILL